MTAVANVQMTLDFEPSMAERFPSLRAYMHFRVAELRLNNKTLAADMDISPSLLSRKLNPGENDAQRMNLDDLESYIKATKDTSPLAYLAAKYMDTPDARKARALARVETLASQMEDALKLLRGAAA